jgi:hypothetical protein
MRCAVCGQDHPDDDIELTYVQPDAVVGLSAAQREVRVQENPDLVVLDGNRFFVRAVLPIPVRGRRRGYNIGVWAELDEAAFHRVLQRWEDADQVTEPAMPAKLANAIRSQSKTLGLDVALRLTGPATRPSVHVVSELHPLHAEQTTGVSVHRVQDYRPGS